MEKVYDYELTEDGYFIFIDGKKVMHQYEPYIPDPSKSYEENAIAQIEELKEADKQSAQEQTNMESLQEQVTDLQLALAEIYENGGTN